MIGVKTAASATLSLLLSIAVVATGAAAPSRLVALGAPVLAGVGAFALIAGALGVALFALGERSGGAFRLSTGPALWADDPPLLGGARWRITVSDGDATHLELPPLGQRALCTLCALASALLCVDGRTLPRLRAVHEPEARVCAAPPAPAAASVAGCELVRRAYALGYTRSLGECAPPAAPTLPPACALPQDDEPAAHFAWRRLRGFFVGLLGAGETVRRSIDEGVRRARSLDALVETEAQVLASAPHALVHLWTPLPAPPGAAFGAPRCDERYRVLPPAPPAEATPSAQLEHALAQLLVDGRYAAPAIACRDVHVHWGAPAEACARLAAHPAEALAAVGALGSVRALLARHRLRARAAAVGPLSRYLTLACYDEGAAATRSRNADLDGTTLSIDELAAPRVEGAVAYFARSRALASLLVRGFHYGRLLSEAGLARRAPSEEAVLADELPLSRLYGLEALDVYLDAGWLAQRPDALVVYPYERHQRNWVTLFRRQLGLARGRL